jgi:hypothetical protein
LRWKSKAIALSAPDIAAPPIRTQHGKAAGVILRSAALFPHDKASNMPMLQEMLQSRRDVERRAVGRTTINRDVLMFFIGQDRFHPCCVRDVTNLGACIRLNGMNISARCAFVD